MTPEYVGYKIGPIFLVLVLILILSKMKKAKKYNLLAYVLCFILAVAVLSIFNINLVWTVPAMLGAIVVYKS